MLLHPRPGSARSTRHRGRGKPARIRDAVPRADGPRPPWAQEKTAPAVAGVRAPAPLRSLRLRLELSALVPQQ